MVSKAAGSAASHVDSEGASRAARAPDLPAFIASLAHPAEVEILALRAVILAADPRIGEAVKWNAPSFFTSDHFATMHLREKRGIGLILHFGAKKNAIAATGVAIDDPSALLQWLAKDRAIVRCQGLDEVRSKAAALTALLRLWIAHLPPSPPPH